MNQKGFSNLLVLLVILLIVGAGGYYFLQNQKPVSPSSISTSKVSPTPDPAASWKTYTDSVNSFSFKYPSDLELKSENNQLALKENPGSSGPDIITASITTNKSDFINFTQSEMCDKVFSDNYKGSAKVCVKEPKDLNLDGVPAKSFEYIEIGIGGGDYRIIQSKKQSLQLKISFVVGKEDGRKVFDQILPTFKFTDQAQTVDTSNWKTYSTSAYSIKYPQDWGGKASEGNSYSIGDYQTCGVSIIGPATVHSGGPLEDTYKLSGPLLSKEEITLDGKAAIKEAYYYKNIGEDNYTLWRQVIVKDPKETVTKTNDGDLVTPVLIQVESLVTTKNPTSETKCQDIFNQIVSTITFNN